MSTHEMAEVNAAANGNPETRKGQPCRVTAPTGRIGYPGGHRRSRDPFPGPVNYGELDRGGQGDRPEFDDGIALNQRARDAFRFAPRARYIPDLLGPVNLRVARWRDRIGGGFCPTAPPLNIGTGPGWVNYAHYIAAGVVIFTLGIFCFVLLRNSAARTATLDTSRPLTLSVGCPQQVAAMRTGGALLTSRPPSEAQAARRPHQAICHRQGSASGRSVPLAWAAPGCSRRRPSGDARAQFDVEELLACGSTRRFGCIRGLTVKSGPCELAGPGHDDDVADAVNTAQRTGRSVVLLD